MFFVTLIHHERFVTSKIKVCSFNQDICSVNNLVTTWPRTELFEMGDFRDLRFDCTCTTVAKTVNL